MNPKKIIEMILANRSLCSCRKICTNIDQLIIICDPYYDPPYVKICKSFYKISYSECKFVSIVDFTEEFVLINEVHES